MIIGHKKQSDFLRQSAASNKISHAYLFSGPEKLGKKTLALEWISSIFNRDLQKFPHPDLIFVEPQTANSAKTLAAKKEIQISQIRNLSWKLSLKPQLANLKAAIINEAHLMNQEAQTSLLKTLEEPRGNTLLILITNYPEILFPTILSRVQNIKFYPVQEEEIKNYLKKEGASEELSAEITELSMGRPGLAVEFAADPEKFEKKKKTDRELTKILDSDIAVRFQYAQAMAKNYNLKDILESWLSYFREILIKKINSDESIKNYSLDKIKKNLKTIQSVYSLISTTNINSRLAMEILMLEL